MEKKTTWKHPISKKSRDLINKKHRLWNRYQETKQPIHLNNYKKLRNIVRKDSRQYTQKFENDIAQECKKNPKKFWQYVNSKTKSYKPVANLSSTDNAGKICIISNDLDNNNNNVVVRFTALQQHQKRLG